MSPSHRTLIALAALALAPAIAAQTMPPLEAAPLSADQPKRSEAQQGQWSVFGQFTNVTQKHNRFRTPYSGANSLAPDGRAEETSDLSLYGGARLWRGAEVWINPEVDQGFGLNGTLGAAGFQAARPTRLGRTHRISGCPEYLLGNTSRWAAPSSTWKVRPTSLPMRAQLTA